MARLSQSVCLQHLIAYPISLNARARRRCRRAALAVPAVPSYAKWHDVSRCHAAGTHTCPCPHLFKMPSPRPAMSRPATRRDLGRWELDQESPCDRHGRSTFSDHCMPASSHSHRRPPRIATGQRGHGGCLGYTPCRPAAGTHRAYHPLPPRRKSGRTYANAIQLPAPAWVPAQPGRIRSSSGRRRTCS